MKIRSLLPYCICVLIIQALGISLVVGAIASAPPLEEGHRGSSFEDLYLSYADITNGLETFDGKLSYIKSKNKKVFDEVMSVLKDMQNSSGAIARTEAHTYITQVYDKIAYVHCDDLDKPGSMVYGKLLSIQGKNSESYTQLITELKSDRYCKDGRIARDAVEARVHAVYVRVMMAWVSAGGFYYTKNAVQSAYNWISNTLFPGIMHAFTTSYAYVKQYSAQVLEQNRQRNKLSLIQKSSAVPTQVQPAVQQVSMPTVSEVVTQKPMGTQSPIVAPPGFKKRKIFNPN